MKKLNIGIEKIDFLKMGGLIPAVIQDANSLQVLMVGFMNKEALEKTLEIRKATFFSRTKKRLWTKGEESGNFLNVQEMKLDCDNDSILIFANPVGDTCHLGQKSCFGTSPDEIYFLRALEKTIQSRKTNLKKDSYTSSLFASGINKISQKVGEEGVEVVIAALGETKERLISESADLLFHWLVLLAEKNVSLDDVLQELEGRS